MDRTSFLGPSLPAEVKGILTPALTQMDQRVFRKMLEYVVEYLKGTEITDENIAELQAAVDPKTASLLPPLFTGLYYILRAAIRTKVAQEDFQKDLGEIKFPPVFAQDLGRVLNKSRALLESVAISKRIHYPTISNLKWRVDVVISTSFLSRIISPVVLMEVTSSDGRVRTFELPIERFHELRYNVAKVLKDMEDLEQIPILKIDK